MIFNLIFLVGFLPLALAQVPSTCNPTGIDDAEDCSQFVTTFCNKVNPEALRFRDANRRCFNLDNGSHCDFTAFNTLQDGGSPSATNCESVLNDIVFRCSRGGQGQFDTGGFTFSVTPSTGFCAVQ